MARSDRRRQGYGGVVHADPRRTGTTGEPLGASQVPPPEVRRPRPPERTAERAAATRAELQILRALLPLRFFLGATFLYAGLDKLLNPAFLREGGAGSIAQQLQGFTRTSPLTPLIQALALPHPIAIGGAMALAEIAIGLGVVLGLFYRPAAFLGFCTAMLFFLTASWSTSPFYYGPDLPYAAGFLTLALVGRPGPYTMAETVESWFRTDDEYVNPRRRGEPEFSPERRAFLQAAVLGAAAVAVGAVAYGASHILGVTTGSGAGTGVLPGAGSGAGTTPAAGTSQAAGGSIATLADLQKNGAVQFQDPSSGDPAWVVEVNGQVAAYDATCTHQGCPVSYAPDQKVFQCPCHGAVFDATNHAQVVQGPAPQPLQPIAVHVDAQGNVVLG